MRYDLVIVGGGVGGCALASTMARAGWSVLVLEKSKEYQDRVRGEWIAPWGVAETQKLDLYQTLLDAGGHHLTSHIHYDESLAPKEAEENALPLGMFTPNVPGPLCIGHPHHCQVLYDTAITAGAHCLRPVDVLDIKLGDRPFVRFKHAGSEHQADAALIVGAEGRQSVVRQAARITLHQDDPHHWFTGLLVDDVDGWPMEKQAIGTEGGFGFLAFPQGGKKIRVYGGHSLKEKGRFSGKDGPRRFLEAFRMESAPRNDALVAGRPAGPALTYFNNDSWTDALYAEGCVLIGDAAGWNDPIIGLGLSITYRDVRIVSDLLKESGPGNTPNFIPYKEERNERMRRLRFAGHLQATLDMEFGEAAKARRHSFFIRSKKNPIIGAHAIAVMSGPEHLPPDLFTEGHRARVLGEIGQ